MKIFIAGATGVLGRRLVARLLRDGHQVVCLVRNPGGERLIFSLGAEPRYGDLFQADTLVRAIEGAEVVIQTATSLPVKRRLQPSDFEMNDRLCREGTQALAASAGQTGARAFLQLSAIRVARPENGSEFEEISPPSPDRFAAAACEGEQIGAEMARRYGFTHSVLRCASLYGPDASHTKMLAEELCKSNLPVIGTGEAVWSLLHLDDAASAFARAAESPESGTWHVVDNRPVTMNEFLGGFARRLGAPPPAQVSEPLARLVAGDCTVTLLTSSTRTSNVRFRRTFEWAPKFSSFEEGLDQVVDEWNSDGFLRQLRHETSSSEAKRQP